MSLGIFFIVLIAAILHAGWNAMVKGGVDKVQGMTAIVLGMGVCGGVSAIFMPIPAAESWPYLLVGVVLHLGYQIFLIASYRAGDLTQIYPIARGLAPVLVAIASVSVLGVHLDFPQILAIALIVAGVLSLGLVRQSSGMRNATAAGLAAVTGCFIAAYSVIDGIGARLSGTSLGFFGWLAFIHAVIFLVLVAVWRPKTIAALPRLVPMIVIGGGASFTAYALVVYAFTHAPIALVTALRETSIVFALLIGVFKLKERLGLLKVSATFLTLAGAAVLQLSKG